VLCKQTPHVNNITDFGALMNKVFFSIIVVEYYVLVATHQTCVQEVLDSNLGLNTSCSG
jgi:hypothetical protein